jgi:hypothetical protein
LCCTELDVITNSIETKPIEKKTHFHINPYFPFMCNFLPLILFLYNLIVPIVIKRLVRDVPDKHLLLTIKLNEIKYIWPIWNKSKIWEI